MEQRLKLPALTNDMIQVGNEELLVNLAVFYAWKFQHTGETSYADEAIQALQAGSNLARAKGRLVDYLAVMKTKLDPPSAEANYPGNQSFNTLLPLLHLPAFHTWYELLQDEKQPNELTTLVRDTLS